MEIGNRIKEHRAAKGWNQDILAEKTYVSRQTVSSWENNRSYPDIKSLLLMSELFGVTLDDLVKGDVDMMKREVTGESIREFNRVSNIYGAGFIIGILIPYPLIRFFGIWGIIAYVLYMTALLILAWRVEILKKQNDIQTYKEILAFTEGKDLGKDEKTAEIAKRPYQKILLAIGAGAITLCVFIIMHLIFG